MALDAGTYTVTIPDASFVGAAYTAAGTLVSALGPGAGDAWYLCTEALDVQEVGLFVTVTTGADTVAFTFNRLQSMGGADIVLATVTGPAGAAVAVDRFLVRRRGALPAVQDPPWHFDKGDLMHFVVTDASAALGAGIFYAKCYPTGGGGNVAAGGPLTVKNIAGTLTTIDVPSTT